MISIIIPTFNEADYIEGVLAQFFTGPDDAGQRKPLLSIPHEIIVTDDGSSDATCSRARQFDITLVDHGSERHLHKRFPHLKNSTIGSNRNFGVRHSKGDLLLFIDAETRIADTVNFFDRAVENFNRDDKLAALTGTLWVTPELESWSDYAVYVVFNWVHRIKNNILGMGEASGKFQMMRRTAFEKIGGFREDLVTREDADMFNRLSRVGRTLCDPKLVIFYTGRRAHALGWPRLLFTWFIETIHVALFDRSISKDWNRVDRSKPTEGIKK